MVDVRDLDLLRLLEEDARQAWRRIAKLLGVSEATVYLRVKKLTEAGVIRGYSVKVDPEKLGLKATLYALVRVRADSYKSFRESINTTKYVSEAYEISGSYHFLLKITAPSFKEAVEIIDEVMAREGVLEVLSFPVMRRLRDSTNIVYDYITWQRGGRARARGHRRS